MASFTPGIPAASHAPSADQPLMLDNYTALQQAQDLNHVALSDITDRGKHKYLQMPAQPGPPNTGNLEGALCTLSQGGFAVLAWRNQNNAPAVVTLTNRPPVNATNGYTSLPNNLLIQWGTTGTSSTSLTVSFNVAFAVAPYNIQVTRQHVAATPGSTFSFWINSASIGTTSFEIINEDGHSWEYQWTAIGVAL